jgi:GntR family transcriptional regulator/MocR family aminotransferase
MAKTASGFVPPFHFDRKLLVPLHRQICDQLRAQILTGRIMPGTRLPSTRTLSREWRLSRNTVLNSFEQLLAEGYLEGKVGAGTWVTRSISADLLRRRAPAATARKAPARLADLPRSLVRLTAWRLVNRGERGGAFHVGVPDITEFPRVTWARIVSRVSKLNRFDLFGYGNPAGYRPLREAVSRYLKLSRSVNCDPEQVFIFSGSQQALYITTQLLVRKRDRVWMEEPGFPGAVAALSATGAILVPVPVDRDGMMVSLGARQAPSAAIAYVTPSHQFPLGTTMSLARRLALLEWAMDSRAWIIEDDYDSEYRYASRPISCLQGLDQNDRVIYMGTFSKVLFPALRIGYAVVPQQLIEPFKALRTAMDVSPPALPQAALAEFLIEGHFVRHIQRMRQIYLKRQRVLEDHIRQLAPNLLEPAGTEAGLHVTFLLPKSADDRAIFAEAAKRGVTVSPLSVHYSGRDRRAGLILGFGDVSERQIRVAVPHLVDAIHTVIPTGIRDA